MNAQEILALPARSLFPNTDEADIKIRFKHYVKEWHPDRCSDPLAADVISHVTDARDRVLNGPKLARATFTVAKSGNKFSFDYLSSRKWEAGEIYVTASAVVYRVLPTFRDLAFSAEKHQWTFVSDKLRDEMTRFLPNPVRYVETETDGTIMIYRRNRDQVLMSDLLERIDGTVPVPHAMWFVSALMNICAYLYTAEFTHFALLPEMLLVSPPMHSVALTGPVLYGTKLMNRPNAVPATVLARYPSLRDKKAKVPHFIADTTQVRQIAMAALGVHDFVQLNARTDVPEGFKRWIMSKPVENSIEDYAAWEKSRGTRRFTPYDLTAQQVYDLG